MSIMYCEQDLWIPQDMASGVEAKTSVLSEPLLEWVQKDKRRFLHAVYRVGDLERTIKYALYEILYSY